MWYIETTFEVKKQKLKLNWEVIHSLFNHYLYCTHINNICAL